MSFLIQFQKDSYGRFLQANCIPEERQDIGLERALRSIFPIKDSTKTVSVEYVSYSIETPRYDPETCLNQGLIYETYLKVVIRLIIWEFVEEQGEKKRIVRDIKEQEVYMGTLPLLTDRGTFIWEGKEVVIPAKISHSSGVFFSKTSSGVAARIIDLYGNAFLISVDKNKKFQMKVIPFSPLSQSALIYERGIRKTLYLEGENLVSISFDEKNHKRQKVTRSILSTDGKVLLKKGEFLTKSIRKTLQAAGCVGIPLLLKDLKYLVSAEEKLDKAGNTILRINEPLGGGKTIKELWKQGIYSIEVFSLKKPPSLPQIPAFETAELFIKWFWAHFPSVKLSVPGRLQTNRVLEQVETSFSLEPFLSVQDWVKVLQKLSDSSYKRFQKETFHLEACGEMLERQCWLGLLAMKQKIKINMLRMFQYIDTIMPHDICNAKPLMQTLNRYFTKNANVQIAKTNTPVSLVEQIRTVQIKDKSLFSSPIWSHWKQKCLTNEEGNDTLFLPIHTKIDEFGTIQLSETSLSIADAITPFACLSRGSHSTVSTSYDVRSLLCAEAPWVRTGLETQFVSTTKEIIQAKREGTVAAVSSSWIVIKPEEENLVAPDLYELIPSRCYQENTPFFQTPIVSVGDHVSQGDILVDSPCTQNGVLALGHNVKTFFLNWEKNGSTLFPSTAPGLIISQRILDQNYFTAVRWHLLVCLISDTRAGFEKITAFPPEVAEEEIRHLDSSGIVTIGSEVKPGDVLVGKQITGTHVDIPWLDSSFRVPDECFGIVRELKVFSPRWRIETVVASREEETLLQKKESLEKQKNALLAALDEKAKQKAIKLFGGKPLAAALVNETGEKILAKNQSLTKEIIQNLSFDDIYNLFFTDEAANEVLDVFCTEWSVQREKIEFDYRDLLDKQNKPADLPPGVLAKIHIIVEEKLPLSLGDTLGDRHGNEEKVVLILDHKDMPECSDSIKPDIIVPGSSISSSALLETKLSFVCEKNQKTCIISPQMNQEEQKKLFQEMGIPETISSDLFDPDTKELLIESDEQNQMGILYWMRKK